MNSPTLAARIEKAYGDLSPQEQRAADFLREHIADLVVYNATEVARLSGVSKATISRLYRSLGFASAEELRDHVRALRASGLPLAGDGPASHSAHLDQESRNLRVALDGLDLDPIARDIARARRVLVLGYRNSYPIALHARQQLAQVRDAVALAPLPGQSLGEELAALEAEDVVLLVGFRRRPEGFSRLIATLAAGPATVVLLTDSSGLRYAARVRHVLECPVDSVSAFDSYAAAASVVSLLAAAVLQSDLAHGRARIARIGEAYESLGELEGF